MKVAEFEVDLGNQQAIGARAEQEDYIAIHLDQPPDHREKPGLLLLLADGMGGHAEGASASVLAVDRFIEIFSRAQGAGNASQRLEKALSNAAAYVHRTNVKHSADMGTTLLALHLDQSGLHWVSVGDSVLMCSSTKGINRLNRDHILGEYLVREVAAGRITQEEANDRQSEWPHLTSYLGQSQLKERDISSQVSPQIGETYLLASDGLTDALSLDEVQSVVCQGGSMQKICEGLIEATLSKGIKLQDNISVVGFRLSRPARRLKLALALIVGSLLCALIAAFIVSFLKPTEKQVAPPKTKAFKPEFRKEIIAPPKPKDADVDQRDSLITGKASAPEDRAKVAEQRVIAAEERAKKARAEAKRAQAEARKARIEARRVKSEMKKARAAKKKKTTRKRKQKLPPTSVGKPISAKKKPSSAKRSDDGKPSKKSGGPAKETSERQTSVKKARKNAR